MIFALWHFTVPMPVCLYACVPAGRQTGRQVSRQAGKNACHPARKNVCQFANLKAYGQAAVLFFTYVAAFGAVVAACGVFEPYFSLEKRPTFAPKRQGKAESAYRRLRLRPSFGQPEGIGRPIPLWVVITGISPIRLLRIFVSSKTQQGVL